MADQGCGKKGVVLVVDDDADIREALTELLADEGFDVSSAANGRDAMDVLRKQSRPCVILLDLMMPVMNGWQFREAQRQDTALAEIPVVVISADRNASDKAATLSPAAVLKKPLQVSELVGTVQRYC